MKKVLSILLVFVLAIGLFSAAALATDPATITVGTQTGNPGDSVTLAVTLENNPGFKSFQVHIDYDTNALELTSINVARSHLLYGGAQVNAASTVATNVAFASGEDLYNESDVETLFTITFEVLDGIKTTSGAVSLTVQLMDRVDKTSVNPTVVAGGVTFVHNHVMTPYDAVPATCTTEGSIKHWSCSICKKNFSDEAGTKELTSVVDPIDEDAHKWAFDSWVWANDYTTAQAKFVCEHNNDHTPALLGATVAEDTTHAAQHCTDDGYVTYTASIAANTDKDTPAVTGTEDNSGIKTVTHEATDHSFGTPTYTETGTTSVTASRTCTVCKFTETETADQTFVTDTPATCDTAGSGHYAATFENTVFEWQSDPVTIDALGHDYQIDNWELVSGENGLVASGTLKCQREGCNSETTVTGTVTEVTELAKPATCTEAAKKYYTASFTLGDKTYTSTDKREYIDGEPLGHDYGAPTWVWEADGSKATATFTCSRNSEHVETVECTKPAEVTALHTGATCTEAATKTLSATVELGDETYTTAESDYHTVTDLSVNEGKPLGHSYAFDSFEWNEEAHTARAKYICKHEETHVEYVDATVGSEAEVTPTCTDVGTTVYTASVAAESAPDGISRTGDGENGGVLSVVVLAKGHNYKFNGFVWNETENTVQAQYTCQNDLTDVQLVAAQMTTPADKQIAAACETGGKTVYVAYIAAADSLDETEHTGSSENNGEKQIPLDPLNHDYSGDPTYTWSADGKTCTAKVVCKNDASHVVTETVNATSAVKTKATCEAKGTTTYTAAFTNEKFETQTKDVEDIDALGHKWDAGKVTKEATPTEKGVVTYTCLNDSNHTKTEELSAATKLEIKEDAVTEEAKTVLAAAVSAQDGYKEDSVAYYEVELLVSFDNGATYEVVTKENMPAEGVVVTLPYPSGTTAAGYDFTVIHGLADGTTEVLVPTETEDGLQVTVKSLSPFAVGYKAAAVTPDRTPEQKTDTKPADAHAPRTGDSGAIALWTVVLLGSTVGAALVLGRKKDR